jgi:hypothetical protein
MAERELIERAMRDPGGAFGSPEAVLSDASLPAEDKRSILQRWREQLAAHDAPAQPEPDFATRIGRALGMLDTETGSHEASHDQGFYTSVNDIGKR